MSGKGGERNSVQGHIPVHGAVYDLFSYLDRIVLAVDLGKRWDASHGLPEETVSKRQNVRLVDDRDVLHESVDTKSISQIAIFFLIAKQETRAKQRTGMQPRIGRRRGMVTKG